MFRSNPNTVGQARPSWPEFTVDRQEALVFDKTMSAESVQPFFYARQVALWSEVFPAVAGMKPSSCPESASPGATNSAPCGFTGIFSRTVMGLAFLLFISIQIVILIF